MSEELSIKARNESGDLFKEGYNCAESVFLAFNKYLDDVDRDSMKMLTAFGRGAGGAGCMCGALVGSLSVISLLTGRTENDMEQRDKCYDYAREFHDIFKAEYKTTCCRALNQFDFKSKEHRINCLKITGKSGKLLMDYLQEKELLEIELIEMEA